jgi:hypothetical protein
MAPPSFIGQLRRGCRHVPARCRAAAAFNRTITAKWMMRGVLLTHARAPIADIGTGSTQQLGRRRKPAHPADGQGAEIGAIPAKTNAELSKLSVLAALHSDHIIGAAIADLSAGRTGIDTVLQVWMWGVIMMVHNAPFGQRIKCADDAKDRPAQLRVAKNSKQIRAVSY